MDRQIHWTDPSGNPALHLSIPWRHPVSLWLVWASAVSALFQKGFHFEEVDLGNLYRHCCIVQPLGTADVCRRDILGGKGEGGS